MTNKTANQRRLSQSIFFEFCLVIKAGKHSKKISHYTELNRIQSNPDHTVLCTFPSAVLKVHEK